MVRHLARKDVSACSSILLSSSSSTCPSRSPVSSGLASDGIPQGRSGSYWLLCSSMAGGISIMCPCSALPSASTISSADRSSSWRQGTSSRLEATWSRMFLMPAPEKPGWHSASSPISCCSDISNTRISFSARRTFSQAQTSSTCRTSCCRSASRSSRSRRQHISSMRTAGRRRIAPS